MFANDFQLAHAKKKKKKHNFRCCRRRSTHTTFVSLLQWTCWTSECVTMCGWRVVTFPPHMWVAIAACEPRVSGGSRTRKYNTHKRRSMRLQLRSTKTNMKPPPATAAVIYTGDAPRGTKDIKCAQRWMRKCEKNMEKMPEILRNRIGRRNEYRSNRIDEGIFWRSDPIHFGAVD